MIIVLILITLFIIIFIQPRIYKNIDNYAIYYYNLDGERMELILWRRK